MSLRRSLDRYFRLMCITCLLLAAASPAQAVTILPLGDSITYGYSTANVSTPGGYREPLYAHFQNAGWDVQFLGSNTGNPGPTLTADSQAGHEGYPKYTIEHIHNNLDGNDPTNTNTYNNGGYWLTDGGLLPAIHPDIILLLAGTNNVEGGTQTAEQIAQKLNDLIAKLFTLRPDTRLYVASAPPHLNDAVKTAKTIAYNELIESQIVPAFAAQGRDITFVDQYANFILPTGDVNPAMFGDRLHPNAAAYQLMGDTWAAAVIPEPSAAALVCPLVLAVVRRRPRK